MINVVAEDGGGLDGAGFVAFGEDDSLGGGFGFGFDGGYEGHGGSWVSG